MHKIETTYLGLKLRSPLIAGSCSLTNKIENLQKLEEAGVGAIVIKSVFEEDITMEFQNDLKQVDNFNSNLEFLDYYDYEIRKDILDKSINLIKEAKSKLDTPIIASINCKTDQNWKYFAQKLEEAGADAIELNMFIMPSNLSLSSQDNENMYFMIIDQIKEVTSIPVALKISPFFSNLGGMIRDLAATNISGIVLFNRFYSPEIDIEAEKIISSNVFSQPNEYSLPLRWTAIMSKRIEADISASTGIHEWESTVRLLLAGAKTVQIVSGLYVHGIPLIKHINNQIEQWMLRHNYSSIEEFRGKLSMNESMEPSNYLRVQYLKYFGDH